MATLDVRAIGVYRPAFALGCDPDDPSSVASAYAVISFPSSEERRGASSRGCLDGFETESR
jgi:hypothetical protein